MFKIYKDTQARKLILDGAKTLYEAVATTYGPTSGNVGIMKDLYGLDITHDGVTVARNVIIDGPEKVGAEVIKNTAIKMDKEQGDGTSTVVILSYSLIEAVQDRLMLGESPIIIKNQLQEEAKIATQNLQKLIKKDVTLETLKQVATISAGDKELGEKVADIAWEVGKNGSILVEESNKPGDSGEVTNGYKIDNGIASNYMIRDVANLSTTLENPHILVVHKKFNKLDMLMPIVQAKVQGPILIIANDFSEDVITNIVSTNQKGLTDITFVKSPRFGEKRLEFLKDIASVVGTEVIDGDKGFDTPMGSAKKVEITQDWTTIIDGSGDTTDRKKTLAEQLKLVSDDYEKKELTDRIASLDGKAAVIKVGGYSENEVNEKKYRVDDAVFACRAALESGIVAGGGTTPLDIAQTLPEGSVLREVLKKPFATLLDNVGLKAADFTVGNGKGVNTRTGKVVDLFEEGIIEPASTIKKAIEAAVSIAGTAITTKVLIVEEQEDE